MRCRKLHQSNLGNDSIIKKFENTEIREIVRTVQSIIEN